MFLVGNFSTKYCSTWFAHSLSLLNYVMAIDSRSPSVCAAKSTAASHSSRKQTSYSPHKHKHTLMPSTHINTPFNTNLMINHVPNQTGFILNSAFMLLRQKKRCGWKFLRSFLGFGHFLAVVLGTCMLLQYILNTQTHNQILEIPW